MTMAPDVAALSRTSDWSGVCVVVAGFGVSGFAAADNLLFLGAQVTALDEATSEEKAEKAELLETLGATIRLEPGATAVLPDAMKNAPRVHTNHPLAAELESLTLIDAFSRVRLENIAGQAVRASNVDPAAALDWFGLAPGTANHAAASGGTTERRRRGSVANPDACVTLVLDPAERSLHVRRGRAAGLESRRV